MRRDNQPMAGRRGSLQPDAHQRAVLDALVEGKSNVDIALRLGVTLEAVREQVSVLLDDAGLDSRVALAGWWASRRSRQTTSVLPIRVGVALAVVALALALGAGALLTGGHHNDTNAEARDPCQPPETNDNLRIVTADDLRRDSGLVSVGKPIVGTRCPMYVDNRGDAAFVWLGGSGYAVVEKERGWGVVSLSACCDERTYSVEYQVAPRSALNAFGGGADVPRPEGFDVVDETVINIRPFANEGAYLTIELRDAVRGVRRRIALASDGELFVEAR
jgi:DNA-binding CsgD family transcriptional regulator